MVLSGFDQKFNQDVVVVQVVDNGGKAVHDVGRMSLDLGMLAQLLVRNVPERKVVLVLGVVFKKSETISKIVLLEYLQDNSIFTN